MKKQTRRDFLKITTISATALVGTNTTKLFANEKQTSSKDPMGVLVDTTVCIGCRKCEWACKKAHDIETKPIEGYDNRSAFEKYRRPDHTSLTVVNEFQNPTMKAKPYDVKVQCMHCNEPACVSACIVGAMTKQENGAVIWDTDKCIGCRFCMVACPFQIPTFEYHEALSPDITKCDFCYERTSEGLLPACVEICPVEAITYGRRSELLKLAHNRINLYPERYKEHILGEHEVGGTSWMYLAGIDFDKLNFPKLSTKSAPGVSEAIQHGIFSYFVPPASLFALLGGIMWLNKNKSKSEPDTE